MPKLSLIVPTREGSPKICDIQAHIEALGNVDYDALRTVLKSARNPFVNFEKAIQLYHEIRTT